MARILAQAGIRAVDENGNDASALVARPRLSGQPWYLWPCNVRTWNVWASVQTQWNTGMGGATGLNYPGVWCFLDRSSGLSPRRRRETFADLQAMERATLDVWGERAERERQSRDTR